MATEQKTKQTEQSVESFLSQVSDKKVQTDCLAIVKLMKNATGYSPKMWGPSIVGFGSYHYRYASGHEGETCLAGFSPRSTALVVYLGPALANKALMAKLGKHKRGVGCLYIKKLDDIDRSVLRKLVEHSLAEIRKLVAAGKR